jgi:hypothetical protein
MATLEVAPEGLAGGHGPLDSAPFHLDYRLRIVIETETGLTTKSCAPTTVGVVGQVLGHGRPPTNHLANGGQRRHPSLGLRQLRRAWFPRVGLAMTHERLLLDLLHITHSDLLEKKWGGENCLFYSPPLPVYGSSPSRDRKAILRDFSSDSAGTD